MNERSSAGLRPIKLSIIYVRKLTLRPSSHATTADTSLVLSDPLSPEKKKKKKLRRGKKSEQAPCSATMLGMVSRLPMFEACTSYGNITMCTLPLSPSATNPLGRWSLLVKFFARIFCKTNERSGTCASNRYEYSSLLYGFRSEFFNNIYVNFHEEPLTRQWQQNSIRPYPFKHLFH